MAPPAASIPTPAVGRSLAAELFVLGYPLVLMDEVRRAHPLASPHFHKLPPTPGGLGGGLGEPDPLAVLSSATIDLAMGPAILHLPDVRGRYYVLTLFDSAGEAFGSLGSRTRDPASPDVVLVGPDWHGEIKGGTDTRRAPSAGVWGVSTIVANAAADLPTAEELAARQCAVPLLNPSALAMAPALPQLEATPFPLAPRIADLAPEVFLHRFRLMLERAPAAFREPIEAISAVQLARLCGPGAADWSAELRQALALGFSDGLAAIAAAARATHGVEHNGWVAAPAGPATTPLVRAGLAYAHLGAPLPDDVLMLRCGADESGRPLSGEERYRIQFPAGGLPPAEAAWRLAALPLGGGGGGPEPSGTVSDRSDHVFGPGDVLELTVQAEAPTAGGALNWLQSPQGPFHLLIRLYGPRAPALAGTWRMPPVERLGSRAVKWTRPTAEPQA